MQSLDQIQKLLRDVKDFPKKGIVFKDITPVLASPGAMGVICEEMAKPFLGKGITKVMAIESRGFFFGPGIAERLNAGLVPVRKAGKLPWQTIQESYALEYGEATLEIHQDAVNASDKVLLIDDVLATGGTLRAAANLSRKLDAEIVGSSCLIEISFLEGRKNLASIFPLKMIHSLWPI